MPTTTLLWLRRDLRLADNPALAAALDDSDRLLPVYIHAPDEEAPWQPGAASRWWLHHSLTALADQLAERGSRLIIARGASLPTLRRLIQATGASRCHWNRGYDPALIARDTRVKQALRADGIDCRSHNAALLFEPWQIKTGAGEPYRVFTPYWRRCQGELARLPDPLHASAALPPVPDGVDGLLTEALDLLPRIPWDVGLRESWQPGEIGAYERLERFIDGALEGYRDGRDLPAHIGTSRLSPHLHFGEISPRQIVGRLAQAGLGGSDVDAFVRELGWREFSYHLLYHFPQTPESPLNPRFVDFPWRDGDTEPLLRAWQRGRTGIPIVDAGMRELWHTGWMHNRVRMIVASLLTKNLRLPWQHGARWFWDTLVDADLANNTQGWQWSAGSGADAAPYFRIFNPVRQGERFDPDGTYVRRWCPELAQLPKEWVHQPWAAPKDLLRAANVDLGRDYPLPIVDLAKTRGEALAAYDQIKDPR
jgi:deoxyribodipyrimidine photo-lyase